MSKHVLLLLLLAGTCSACLSPRRGSFSASSKPGWGRVYSPEEERLKVRVVPAALTPVNPITPLGKPGWGQTGGR